MKKINTALSVIIVLGLCGAARADSSKVESGQELTAEVGTMMDKPLYTGPPNVPDPNVILQGGDTFADAMEIFFLPFSDLGTTEGYTDNYDRICPYNAPGSPDVVYSYVPPTDMYVSISVCNGSAYDTKLYVYENDQFTVIGCNDDLCDGPNSHMPVLSKLAHIFLTAGNTYYIVVDGYGGAYGEYTIDIEEITEPAPPLNDRCSDAEPIGDVFLQPFCTCLATASGMGICMNSPDIWYVYASPCNSRVFVTLMGSGFDTKLAVYDGNTCSPLPEMIACNDDAWSGNLISALGFDAIEGNQYLIQVGGYAGNFGDGNITIMGCGYPQLCQESVLPDGFWGFWTSDVQYGPPYICYDNYPYIEHTCEIRFWGADARSTSQGWVDCIEDPMNFIIWFYPDDGTGRPDRSSPACVYNVTPTRTGTGDYYPPMGELYEFYTELVPCCDLTEGWIAVMGNTYPGNNCVFLWQANINADHSGFQYVSAGLTQRFWDFSRCLVEGAGCNYIIGDYNGNFVFNIADIVAAFAYLQMGSPQAAYVCECPMHSGNEWAVAMDLNNTCEFNIADVIEGFSRLQTGSPSPEPCADCPPPGW